MDQKTLDQFNHLSGIVHRLCIELDKASKREDKETYRLLKYIYRGATFGEIDRGYEPKLRKLLK